MDFKISIIITAPEDKDADMALRGLESQECPARDWEVILALGDKPSAQRNAAANLATGAILLFLDNDSVAATNLLELISDPFSDPLTAAVGGPNLPDPEDKGFRRVMNAVHSSPFYSGWTAKRWASVGIGPQKAGEGDLILCNLAFRREIFLELGGFDEALYPNEENDLMSRMEAGGYKLWYVPQAAVFRSREADANEFLQKQVFYGAGRGREFWRRPASGAVKYLAPLLGGIAGLWSASRMLKEKRQGRAGIGTALTTLGLGAYFGVGGLVHRRHLTRKLDAPFFSITGAEGLAPLGHGAYALGLIWGLISGPAVNTRRLKAPAAPIIRMVKSFGEPYSYPK